MAVVALIQRHRRLITLELSITIEIKVRWVAVIADKNVVRRVVIYICHHDSKTGGVNEQSRLAGAVLELHRERVYKGLTWLPKLLPGLTARRLTRQLAGVSSGKHRTGHQEGRCNKTGMYAFHTGNTSAFTATL